MFRAALIALVLGMVPIVNAATPTVDPAECLVFADMALVARALAKEGVDKEKAAAVVSDVYQMPTPELAKVAASLLSAAYGDPRTPRNFAAGFYLACLTSKLDGFLGVSI